ncbi:MarR family transcriptional regulator [Actinomycetospora rhizophila]|uniref:MarR family transcriptional regulator n=1 Tax=Actinomycetospora rhizophila TaxID=1416876 RepID=A0ABV9ZF74_9PSEU
MDDGRFRTLHALRVKGLTSPAVAAEIVSLSESDAQARLTELEAEGLVRHRGAGRVQGWTLTKEGKAAHAELLADAVDADARAALDAAYDGFLPVNGDFKEVCTAWQTRGDGTTPNDHTDAAYDAAVIERLAEVDARVDGVLRDLGGAVDRMAGYRPRLTDALARVRDGDATAFTAPMTASYHDVWMELHQDLIVSLGLTRGAADE